MAQLSGDLQTSFLGLVQLRFMQRKKALYKRLGLSAVRQVIEYLGTLTGVPPSSEQHYEDWGMREVQETVPGPVHGSLRSALSVIERTPPYGTYVAFGLDPDNQALLKEVAVPGQKVPAGLRDLLLA